ncbi:hypothetical protein BU14_0217s0022 [Porphyra umbilicalis]|uniref:Inhibitor I9 domain-containing protein n=1 Tax=Porphyra umbilicalis TaxID=2786 RepID=A0A1X6P4Y8_PORUM|nr:hypothetical protein BU14_0217s0018 [Porphyra umbilicalis]OSX75908.1 hypothetical protein BU14_0217s0022 [Porphyra umbilicalis]|eukprot:OSX75905.1 hypothetical protein BU14_0217s0018 [Porphyra umbilicalis]
MAPPRAGTLPLLVAAAAAAIVALSCVATRVDSSTAAAPPTKRYIVTLTHSAAPADAVRSAVRRVQARARAAVAGGGAPALRVLDEYRTIGGLLVEGTPADAEAVRAMDGVLFVEEDGIVTAA